MTGETLSGTGNAPVAVIAGGGVLPMAVIESARASGRAVYPVGIRDEADTALSRFDPLWVSWGQIGRMFSQMKNAGVRDVVLIGGVSKRPDFRSVAGDLGTMRRLPRILKTLARGDDGLLQGVIRIFEDEGFRVIGAHELAPGLLVGAGPLGRISWRAEHRRDLALGLRAATELGRLDIGQAAVAVNGRIIAVEAAEGTDAMLRRCAELRAAGRVKWQGRAGVLVKAVKPQQDARVDLPSIGPNTAALVAECGLSGIAVTADRVLCAERDELARIADGAGLFVAGLGPSELRELTEAADD